MQSNKLRTTLFKLLKILIAVGVLLFCLIPFLPNNTLNPFASKDLVKYSEIPFECIPLIVLLSVFNFGLEALKWRLIGNLVEKFSIKTAIKAVLAGVAVSSVFPWRSGEFIARIAWLKEENRVKGAYFSIYSSMTQLFVTIALGFIGLLLFANNSNSTFFSFTVQITSILVMVILILFLLVFRNKVIQWIGLIVAGSALAKYFKELISIPMHLLLQLIGLSFLRYLAFLIPYIILIGIKEPALSPLLIAKGIAVVFLLQSIIPGFLLSDLPVKGYIHITIFASIIADTWVVGNAVVIVFIANQIVPALLGAVILLLKKMK